MRDCSARCRTRRDWSGRVGLEAMVSRKTKPDAAVVVVVDNVVRCRAEVRRRCAMAQRRDCENSSPVAANAAWWRGTANCFTVTIGPAFAFWARWVDNPCTEVERHRRGGRNTVPDSADRTQLRRGCRANDANRTCRAGMSENRRSAPVRCVAIALQESLPMRHDPSSHCVAAARAALPSAPR